VLKWTAFCTANDMPTRQYQVLVAVQLSTQACARVLLTSAGVRSREGWLKEQACRYRDA
jgi:hypothetical protein